MLKQPGGKAIFLDTVNGDDNNGGTGPDDCVLTRERAWELMSSGCQEEIEITYHAGRWVIHDDTD